MESGQSGEKQLNRLIGPLRPKRPRMPVSDIKDFLTIRCQVDYSSIVELQVTPAITFSVHENMGPVFGNG